MGKGEVTKREVETRVEKSVEKIIENLHVAYYKCM